MRGGRQTPEGGVSAATCQSGGIHPECGDFHLLQVVGLEVDTHYRLWFDARYVTVVEVFCLAFAFLGMLGAGLCLLAVYQSAPVRLVASHQSIVTELGEVRAQVEAMRVAWTKYRAELEGVLEAVEDTLEVTERKRRRAVSAAAKLPDPDQQVDDLVAMRRRARAAGVPV